MMEAEQVDRMKCSATHKNNPNKFSQLKGGPEDTPIRLGQGHLEDIVLGQGPQRVLHFLKSVSEAALL